MLTVSLACYEIHYVNSSLSKEEIDVKSGFSSIPSQAGCKFEVVPLS